MLSAVSFNIKQFSNSMIIVITDLRNLRARMNFWLRQFKLDQPFLQLQSKGGRNKERKSRHASQKGNFFSLFYAIINKIFPYDTFITSLRLHVNVIHCTERTGLCLWLTLIHVISETLSLIILRNLCPPFTILYKIQHMQ